MDIYFNVTDQGNQQQLLNGNRDYDVILEKGDFNNLLTSKCYVDICLYENGHVGNYTFINYKYEY